ncbi:MAG: helix-turn-helix transcriptional regulator [Bacteroidota bacterium]
MSSIDDLSSAFKPFTPLDPSAPVSTLSPGVWHNHEHIIGVIIDPAEEEWIDVSEDARHTIREQFDALYLENAAVWENYAAMVAAVYYDPTVTIPDSPEPAIGRRYFIPNSARACSNRLRRQGWELARNTMVDILHVPLQHITEPGRHMVGIPSELAYTPVLLAFLPWLWNGPVSLEEITDGIRTLDTVPDDISNLSYFQAMAAGLFGFVWDGGFSGTIDNFRSIGQTFLEDIARKRNTIEKEISETSNPDDALTLFPDPTPLPPKGRGQQERRRKPDPAEGGTARYASSPILIPLQAAINNSGERTRQVIGGWQIPEEGTREAAEGYLVYNCQSGNYHTQFRVKSDRPADDPFLALEELDENIVGSIAHALLAAIVDPGLDGAAMYPRRGTIDVSIEMIENIIGPEPHVDRRHARRKKIRKAMAFLRKLEVTITSRTKKLNEETKQWELISSIGNVFHISSAVFPDGSAVAWSVQVGTWGRHFLNEDSRPMIQYIERSFLTASGAAGFRSKKRAKQKIGRYVSVVIASAGNTYTDVKLDTMAERTGGRFQDAKLQADALEVIIDSFEQINSASNTIGIIPASAADDRAIRSRGPGWTGKALAAKLRAYDKGRHPNGPPLALPPAPVKRTPAKNGDASTWTIEDGEELRALRTRLGKSQSDVAYKLGIERSYLAHLEKAKRTPNPDLTKRLRAWIVSAQHDLDRE